MVCVWFEFVVVVGVYDVVGYGWCVCCVGCGCDICVVCDVFYVWFC